MPRIDLPQELYDQLKIYAENQFISINSAARRIITKHLSACENTHIEDVVNSLPTQKVGLVGWELPPKYPQNTPILPPKHPHFTPNVSHDELSLTTQDVGLVRGVGGILPPKHPQNTPTAGVDKMSDFENSAEDKSYINKEYNISTLSTDSKLLPDTNTEHNNEYLTNNTPFQKQHTSQGYSAGDKLEILFQKSIEIYNQVYHKNISGGKTRKKQLEKFWDRYRKDYRVRSIEKFENDALALIYCLREEWPMDLEYESIYRYLESKGKDHFTMRMETLTRWREKHKQSLEASYKQPEIKLG